MIRPATREDIPAVLRMCGEFARHATDAVAFDVETMRGLLEHLIANADAALLVAQVEGRVRGVIAMLAFPVFFNARVLMAQELFWWLDEEVRRGGLAVRLLAAAESWAQERGAQMVNMLALEHMQADAIGQLYQRRGYRPLERAYVRHF